MVVGDDENDMIDSQFLPGEKFTNCST
jgi:hypothetical protein